MPSTSPAQKRTMAAAAHNPAFAKKMGIPVSVAKEFNQADKGKHMKKGGHMKSVKPRLPAALMAAAEQAPPPNASAGPITSGQPGGMPPGAPGMKHGGGVKKMAAGGETVKSEEGHTKKWSLKGEDKDAHGEKVSMKRGGKARGFGIARKGYSGGGGVRSGADGIAERGHTRGKFI